METEIRNLGQSHIFVPQDYLIIFSFMSSIDENITYCLQEIDANLVKAIDVVGTMKKSIKEIAKNLKELDECSKVCFDSSFLIISNGIHSLVCVTLQQKIKQW